MKLICIGDVALANDKLCQLKWMPPGGVALGDDVKVLFNWELPVGTTINPVPRSSGPRLLACPDSTNVIRSWSPGFATLANNHILDAGEEGLANTLGSLNRAGFTTVGAGRTQEEITRPLIWETAEGRLAVVNWVFPETHPDWMSVPGPNCWPGRENAKNLIQQLKSQTDWVMVVVHWSDELFPYPRPEDRAVAGELSRMGADLVVGHHPHVVRGMEVIGFCPVFYSIGNFYFSDISDGYGGWITREAPRNREGLGVQVSFRRGERPEYRILSFWQAKRGVSRDPFRRAERRMERVNRSLQRFQDSKYTEWYTIRRARFNRWDYRWHFRFWKIGRGDAKRIFLKLVRHFLETDIHPLEIIKIRGKMNFREAVYFGLVGLRGQALGAYYKQILREEQNGIPPDTTKKLLVKLLAHCRKLVPYYAKIMNQIGDSFDGDPEEYLRHFPILTKEIIRNRFEELKSGDLERRKWYFNTSGGSTGEPVRFIQDWEYAARTGAISLLYSKLIGREIGELAVQIWGSERDIISGGERCTARIINKITNIIFVNAFCLTPQRLREFIAQLNARPPKLIVCYTKLMYEIAMFVERERLKVVPQAAIITTAETLFPFMRNKIQDIFGCNVFNRYGSREVGDIACECPELRGLWVAPWGNHVEIVDSVGKQVPDNSEGEILVTSLTNYAMPLVRYRIGDRGVISSSEGTDQDKNKKVIREVLGRISDTFKTKNGTLVDPGYFEYLLYFKDWIFNFQVIQKDYLSIVFKIVKSKTDPQPDELKEIVAKTRIIMGNDCQVDFEFIDKIPDSESGKYRYTISEIAEQSGL